jgi:hypothetical protein
MIDGALTLAQAAFLLNPAARTAGLCVESGLLQLLAVRRVTVDAPTGILKDLRLTLAEHAGDSDHPLPPHLAALEAALRQVAAHRSLTGLEVASALQDRFGSGYERYLHDEIAPSLIGRGLLTRRDDKLLRLFPRIRYTRTAQGEKLTAAIELRRSAVDAIPRLLRTDPAQAIRVARSAGPLILLSPAARRAVPKLRRAVAECADVDALLMLLPEHGRDIVDGEFLLDLEELAWNLDALLAGIEAVADAAGGADGGSSDGGG